MLRIRGEYDAAEAAYDEAVGYGHDPQPGLALLWLARGRSEAAVGAVRRLLAEPRDPVHRSRLLPAAVEVLLAVGDDREAGAAADELDGVATAFGCAALRAMAATRAGSSRSPRDDRRRGAPAAPPGAAALAGARRAVRGGPRRVLLGRALRVLGDEESAVADLTAARRTFAELGATPAEQRVDRLLAAPTRPAASPPARWRCCGWWRPARATPRSPPSCS